MTTVKCAAVDARQHDSADEVSKFLVSLEGARGCFSGKVIDYRMPCTAAANTTCQIVASLSLWNEFLCWLELELRDLSETGRQLGLAHVGVTCLPWPTESRMRQAAAVLYWLLKTHRCIASICVASSTFSPEIAQLRSAVLCDVLCGNDSVKSLALESASTVQSERFCEVILSLQRLEQLRCAFVSNRSAFPRTVSAFLQASTTLTVLDFRVSLETAQARLLVTALRANSTLRDLSLSATAILAEPASFVTFLSGTATLERLKVVGSAGSLGDDALKWIFEGMLENGTVSTLEAHELHLDSESVELGARVLAQSKVLRRFELLRSLSLLESPLVRELTGSAVSHDTASWQEAILQNDTIRYVTLRLNTWTDEYWGRFFRLLSRDRSLKLVTVVAGKDECGRLSAVAEKLDEAGCEDKVSLVASCAHDTFSLANCKRCPELRARIGLLAVAETLSVFQQLSAFSCLKIVRLAIEDWEKELCWLFAEYVSTTCTLRTLDLQLTVPELPPESLDWWPALSRALLLNRSITDFGLGVFVDSCEDVECLGEAVARSSTIRKLRLLMWLPAARRSFLRGMHAGIFENRTLCSATLDSGSTYGPWAADWFVVCDTARRNWGCVPRAAQFLNHARQDT
ncbi:hypothetical protein HPB50_024334 [Hyalomma asiaticum]|uniref:Uncharacterized protein n=1 Tax=Hyalomma asiaticum TaxID=266040 RepID=A0ACB7T8S1_HYAAI|nr:hypothetical protein HPB50_024334 [Hyalomma asiaticum]